jgi:MYXO-CTERM domain-containing protein
MLFERLRPILLAAIAGLVGLAAPRPAQAHWCDDLWGSSYNLVIRPETDTVTVPASGSVDLRIWVQNNMGYPLVNFTLDAAASGYTISVSRQAPTVTNYLMPGEKLEYTLTIARDGGASVSIEEIEFYASFGEGDQSRLYGASGEHAMIRRADGGLFPAAAPGVGEGNYQAMQLRLAATADFGDLASGLDGLMQEYCAGRRSWDHSGTGGNPANCPDTTTTVCSSASVDDYGTLFDWTKAWAAQELMSRKSALGARAAVMRDRFVCGLDDPNLGFVTMAAFGLGYLGEDAGARAALEGLIDSGSADEQAVAKAALLLFGDPDDATAYHADVVAGLGSSNFRVEYACAAALGIVDQDDAAVTDHLIANARWTCAGGCDSASDDGRGFLAAHLLAVVAWDRRGWAVDAGDTGAVSFYNDETPSGNQAPNCTAAAVLPDEAVVPFDLALDASGCTDPDGDALTFQWRVPTSTTTEEVYDTSVAQHALAEPGNYTITLTVTDDDPEDPRETSRQFFVTALPEGSDPPGEPAETDALIGGCGCAAGDAPSGALLVLVAGVWLGLRRRPRAWPGVRPR